MKRAVIVHGYKGKPDTNWKPWLKTELEANGWSVAVPEMPHTEHPIASEWQTTLAKVAGEPSSDLFLIGHSLGSITILRYLETLTGEQRVGGVVLVAGFGERFQGYGAGNHDTFFDHELDWQHIRKHCGKVMAFNSDSDPHIELEQLDLFKRELGAEVRNMEGMGHFGSADGVRQVPFVYESLIRMSDSH